jgi:nitrogen-specific signal transduction histidine kinase
MDTSVDQAQRVHFWNADPRVRGIVDSMPSILVGVDAHGRITLWNKAAVREQGQTAAQAIGRPLAELFPYLERQLGDVGCVIQFEPCFTTKPAGVGTGLGLAVAYFIVTEQHHGSLQIESAPGHCARFILRLPRQEARHGADSPDRR